MKFAITPCPNDTFSYEALISKKIKSGLEFEFADIEELNIAAESGKYPLTKMSFPAYIKNSGNYELLDAGAALGMGTGPILVVKKGGKFDPSKPVLVPGLNTTAAALLKFYAGGDINMKAAYFRDISGAISSGEAAAGVLIHEGRFVFADEGLELAADLLDKAHGSSGAARLYLHPQRHLETQGVRREPYSPKHLGRLCKSRRHARIRKKQGAISRRQCP